MTTVTGGVPSAPREEPSPGAPIHNVQRRWVGPPIDEKNRIPGINVRVYEVATIFGDWDAIPVIEDSGRPSIVLRQRAIYPGGDGLWGCAICEGWHRIETKQCPLAHIPSGQVEQVVIGPIYHDDDQVMYVQTLAAVGSYVHGQMDTGVAIWRLADVR